MELLVCSINTVAIDGLEPPKHDPHLIYSQTPLPLGSNRHKWMIAVHTYVTSMAVTRPPTAGFERALAIIRAKSAGIEPTPTVLETVVLPLN